VLIRTPLSLLWSQRERRRTAGETMQEGERAAAFSRLVEQAATCPEWRPNRKARAAQ
jgi:hypothetical protein